MCHLRYRDTAMTAIPIADDDIDDADRDTAYLA